MEKRERETERQRKTTPRWTVVHLLFCKEADLETSHAERSPLNCFAQKH